MQRVMVARAIAQGSPTLLLDEPSSALDIQHQQRIYSILQELNRGGSTIIVTTHDLNLAAQYCKRLLLLHQGRIVADGSPEQALTQDMVERVYGTQVELLHRNGRITVLPKTPTGANP